MKKYVILLAVIVIAAAGLIGFNYLADNKMPGFTSRVELYVRPGDDMESVITQLKSKTGIVNERRLRKVFKEKQVESYLKPGHYILKATDPVVYAARMLNNGWQSPVNMTLSGSLRLKGEIARKISNQMLLDSAQVRRALDDSELLARYGYTPSTVFSLLMPDSYEIYWDASVEDILDRQKQANDAFWTQDNVNKARKLGLSKLQVSILASIVKGESNYQPEFAKIAGVYLNRLHKGMPLQADPTVAFCYDYKLNRILLKHLSVDSPYNTYKNAGLPPGPICVPTRECLEAVLNPDYGGGNIFFCANPDFSGTHVFARTLDEHNRNARAFQQELNRRARKNR